MNLTTLSSDTVSPAWRLMVAGFLILHSMSVFLFHRFISLQQFVSVFCIEAGGRMVIYVVWFFFRCVQVWKR